MFTQGVIAPAARTLYVGGQLGTDSTGELLEGIEAQATQAMRNVSMVLAAAGTGPEHVVRLNIYLVHGVDAQVGYAASRSVWGDHRTPSRLFPPQDTLAQVQLWRSTQ